MGFLFKTTPDIPKPPPSPSGPTPWLDWMKERIGWTEFDHDKELSKYWPLVGLNYDSVIGKEHAWCALAINAALHDTGFHGNGRADAKSFESYGTPSPLVPGAILVFQWDSGEHHVTLLDHIVDASEVACLGGNQGNAIKVVNYPRRSIVAVRWPVKG